PDRRQRYGWPRSRRSKSSEVRNSTKCVSLSRTRDAASMQKSWTGSSTDSSRETRRTRDPWVEPGWGWHSAGGLWNSTEAASGRRAKRAKAAVSFSHCPARPQQRQPWTLAATTFRSPDANGRQDTLLVRWSVSQTLIAEGIRTERNLSAAFPGDGGPHPIIFSRMFLM